MLSGVGLGTFSSLIVAHALICDGRPRLLPAGEEQLAFSAGKLVQIIADNHDNREACRESGMISALLVRGNAFAAHDICLCSFGLCACTPDTPSLPSTDERPVRQEIQSCDDCYRSLGSTDRREQLQQRREFSLFSWSLASVCRHEALWHRLMHGPRPRRAHLVTARAGYCASRCHPCSGEVALSRPIPGAHAVSRDSRASRPCMRACGPFAVLDAESPPRGRPAQEITWYAANALRELCLDSQSCREEVSQLGAVRTLTGLLDVGLDQVRRQRADVVSPPSTNQSRQKLSSTRADGERCPRGSATVFFTVHLKRQNARQSLKDTLTFPATFRSPPAPPRWGCAYPLHSPTR